MHPPRPATIYHPHTAMMANYGRLNHDCSSGGGSGAWHGRVVSHPYGRCNEWGQCDTTKYPEERAGPDYGAAESDMRVGWRTEYYGIVRGWGDGGGSINSAQPEFKAIINYTHAKNDGVPECVIDLELIEDPTLSRYAR